MGIELDLYERSVAAGLKDIEYYKTRYDETLLSGDYTNIHYYSLFMDSAPEFLCSGSTFVECDFHGNTLQGENEFGGLKNTLEQCTFNLISDNDKGVAIFSWIDDKPKVIDFIRSFDALPNDKKGSAIARFAIEFFENIAYSPSWYDELEENRRNSIHKRVRESLDEGRKRSPRCLLEEDIDLVTWVVDRIETNL